MNKLLFTKGVNDLIIKDIHFANAVTESLERYQRNDWGDLCDEDKKTNQDAIKNGERIFARYNIKPRAIYIITEWDRSATTILFPEEY